MVSHIYVSQQVKGVDVWILPIFKAEGKIYKGSGHVKRQGSTSSAHFKARPSAKKPTKTEDKEIKEENVEKEIKEINDNDSRNNEEIEEIVHGVSLIRVNPSEEALEQPQDIAEEGEEESEDCEE